jgi:hypothetical protein
MLGALAGAACARPVAPADDVAVEWRATPSTPLVDGETEVEVTLLDRARQPLNGARLRVEAHMTHPGMAPIIEVAAERGNGAYVARLRLPMAGGWILFVKGELADHRPVNRRVGEVTARGRLSETIARSQTPALTPAPNPV